MEKEGSHKAARTCTPAIYYSSLQISKCQGTTSPDIGVICETQSDERVEMFRHENVSQDSEFQFPPQLAQSRNPLLPKTLGVKSVN